MSIPETLLRVTIGFAVLLILIRITGNKQLGQMNVFTYISGIALGGMIAEMIMHNDVKLVNAINGRRHRLDRICVCR